MGKTKMAALVRRIGTRILRNISKYDAQRHVVSVYEKESDYPYRLPRERIIGKIAPYKSTDDDVKTEDVPGDFRLVYPELLPDPNPLWRNKLREKLERYDMLTRREVMAIPEFYVGSIMAVTVSDPNASGKTNRFLGICILRGGTGLCAWFMLRNVIDHQGVEILYEMYNPLIQSIETLRLEKRLDEELLYLRDALPEYSTFPLDMEPEPLLEGTPVPVNPLKVKLKPRPWHSRWERFNLQGVEKIELPTKFFERAKRFEKPWEKYDLMKDYRATISEEEQRDIFVEVSPSYPHMEAARRRIKRSRT